MGAERGPLVKYTKDNESENKTIKDLIDHMQKMGLQTGSFLSGWAEFAEFDISHEGQIRVEVKRPDGNLTRCYLTKSSDTFHNYVYLQIDTNIKPDDINTGTEARGIFPVAIIGVGSSTHLSGDCYDTLNFITSNGGYVGITESGTIDFGQGKF